MRTRTAPYRPGAGRRAQRRRSAQEGSFDTLVKDASHNSYNAVSKFGKNVDAIVQPDISAACRGVEMDKETLNRVIAEVSPAALDALHRVPAPLRFRLS